MIYEDLKGKRILVTGSSSGIGAAAIFFAKQYLQLRVSYMRGFLTVYRLALGECL